MIRIDNDWEFVKSWSEEFLQGGKADEVVTLPHTVQEVSLHEVDKSDYEGVYGYRKVLHLSDPDKKYFLQFDGAAHIATVYCNGKELCTHKCGYTAFRVDLMPYVVLNGETVVTVKLDASENSSIPPFGYVIDYLTYGGLYRHVWLDEKDPDYIEDVFVYTPNLNTAVIRTAVVGQGKLCIAIKDGEKLLAFKDNCGPEEVRLTIDGVKNWSPENPYLYTCEVKFGNDTRVVRFGFRTVGFDQNHFLLNGKPYFIRGLNRHQCYPYVGYAVSDSLQREDARILKEELHVNAVRTSHYPQSQAFIDACDELGLLVFTEIPGWQHIGDMSWQKQAVENTKEMVRQYRNHPSIFLWGVRINESLDNDDFYRQTNAAAHALDPSRLTSGVRYLEKSSLLEDVYSFNDFSHAGNNPGVKKKKDVLKDPKKPLIISEANGHMFPTKVFDSWGKRQEQALRHARVLNDAMADGEHAGCFQWCMFDYPTHSQFGSGDRICYHGVLDSFRNPKTAAYVYASQSDAETILEPGVTMDIGDFPEGRCGSFYVFTNVDEIRLYKDDEFVQSFTSKEFPALEHGPICVDDLVGSLLKKENLTEEQEKHVHRALQAAAKHGLAHLPVSAKLDLAWCLTVGGLKYSQGVDLFGKYVSSWGSGTTKWRLDGVKDGKVCVSRTLCPSHKLHLNVKVSETVLEQSDSYDMAAIRIRILDENNMAASYAQYPVCISVDGPLKVVGPAIVTAEGGMCGTYVRTNGAGTGKVTISVSGCESVEVNLEVKGHGVQ